MNKTAKMMIASNGRQSAVLLDGVMIGAGVDSSAKLSETAASMAAASCDSVSK